MSRICKNCHHVLEGNFCSNCGQPASTDKIGIHFLWHDIQHAFFHFDAGLYYTIRQLFTRPGHSIREYIHGKRIQHFKPVSLVIILASLYGFLFHYFHINTFVYNETSNNELNDTINEWLSTHYALFTFASIPIYTIGTFIAFRKMRYNYAEYFLLNSFKAAQRLILRLITFPVLYYFNQQPGMRTLLLIYYICDLLLTYWTNMQFFNQLPKLKTLLLTLLSQLIFLSIFVLILLVIIVIMKGS